MSSVYDRSEFTIAGRAGVPMEVMGLMLGQFIDEYTINCVDVWFSDFFLWSKMFKYNKRFLQCLSLELVLAFNVSA